MKTCISGAFRELTTDLSAAVFHHHVFLVTDCHPSQNSCISACDSRTSYRIVYTEKNKILKIKAGDPMQSGLKQALSNIQGFFKGAFDFHGRSRSIIENEAQEEMDNFLLICFGDALGLPIPVSYYTLELLPYLEDELKDWEERMMDKKTVWEQRAVNMDYDY